MSVSANQPSEDGSGVPPVPQKRWFEAVPPELTKAVITVLLGAFGFFLAYLIFFKLVGEGQMKAVTDSTTKHIGDSGLAAGKAIDAAEKAINAAEEAKKKADDAKKAIDGMLSTARMEMDNKLDEAMKNISEASQASDQLIQKNKNLRDLNSAIQTLLDDKNAQRIKDLESFLKLGDTQDAIKHALAAAAILRPELHGAKFAAYPRLTEKSAFLPETTPINLKFKNTKRLVLMSASGVLRDKGKSPAPELRFSDQDGKPLGSASWYAPNGLSGWNTFSIFGLARVDESVESVRLKAVIKAGQPVDYEFHDVSLEVVEWPVNPG